MNRIALHAAATALALLTGCAVNQAPLQGWHGRSLTDLAAAWGPPESLQRMPDGRQGASYQSRVLSGGDLTECRVWFVASPSGLIEASGAEGASGYCNTVIRRRPAAR